MTGNYQPAAGADKSPDEPVESDIAASRQARLLGRRGARLARGIASRKDDEIGVEVQVEYVLERQQPVRAGSPKAGKKRRLRGAFSRTGGDDAMGGEMQDAVLIEVVSCLDRGVGELVAGHHLDAIG